MAYTAKIAGKQYKISVLDRKKSDQFKYLRGYSPFSNGSNKFQGSAADIMLKKQFDISGTLNSYLHGLHPTLKKAHELLVKNSSENPNRTIKAALEANLTPNEVVEFIGAIVKHFGTDSPVGCFAARRDTAMFNLVTIALEAKIRPALITMLVERTEEQSRHASAMERLVDIYSELAASIDSALTAAINAKLTHEQIANLFATICKKEFFMKEAFNSLPAAIATATDAQLSPEQIASLFGKMMQLEKTPTIVFRQLFPALTAAQEVKLSNEQIIELLKIMFIRLGNSAVETMQALPEAFIAAQEAKLTADQTFSIFYSVIYNHFSSSGEQISSPLAAALRSAKLTLSAEQIVSLLTKLTESEHRNIFDALCTLPAAFKAKVTPDQTLNLFGKINNIDIYRSEAFGVISSGLEAKLTPDQILYLLDKVSNLDFHYHDIFKALPAAITTAMCANMKPDQIVSLIGQIIENNPAKAKSFLALLPATTGTNLKMEQIVEIFEKINKKCGNNTEVAIEAFNALFTSLPNDPSTKANEVEIFFRMLDTLTDYNRGRVLGLLANNETLFHLTGQDNFTQHYALYMNIIMTHKKLALQILEGVFEADRTGIISRTLGDKEIEGIGSFINATHSFSPIVYKVYKTKGEPLISELRSFSQNVVADGLGEKEINDIINKYDQYDGMEFLYSIIQMSIPLSGASFVKREEGKSLLKRMIDAGDLRGNVPQALKGKSEQIFLGQTDFVLKKGAKIDLQIIGPILDGLRSGKKAELSELVASIKTYLSGNRSEADKEALRQTLYRYASNKDLLGEKVERLGTTDYHTLTLLEEIFNDKDSLGSMLERASKEVDQSLFTSKKVPLIDASVLITSLNKMWTNNIPDSEKIKILVKMTSKYIDEDVRVKVIGSDKINKEVASRLSEVISTVNIPTINASALISDILSSPLSVIRQERSKFEKVDQKDSAALTFRVVKSIPYGLWGLNAGVCIAADMELWKDPKFKLIAMTDESNKTAGFIHIYEAEIKGEKAWTLPGIEPNAEFIGTVNAKEFYDKAIEKVNELAKAAGMSGVYLPARRIIYSNRADIQKVIADKKYTPIKISEISWSRNPKYPFNEVFALWEKR
jgi:hypothetical protein